MLQRHQVRRLMARYSMQAGLDDRSRMSLTDPLFNLREIVKQMILLEDHLSHPYKLCPDCVRKHILCIEGFAEEAVSLDQEGTWLPLTEGLADMARLWMEQFTDGRPPKEIADDLRVIRKQLTPQCCDPRGEATRVASLWLQKVCPHRG